MMEGAKRFLLAPNFIVTPSAEPHVPICPPSQAPAWPRASSPGPPSQASFSWRVSTGPGRFMALVPSASVTRGQPEPPGTKSAP